MMVTHWSHHVTRIDASHSDEGCKMLLLLCLHTRARTHSPIDAQSVSVCSYTCTRAACSSSSILQPSSLCDASTRSRDVTNGSPSYTAIYFVAKNVLKVYLVAVNCLKVYVSVVALALDRFDNELV